MYINELLPTSNQVVNAGVETSREKELGRNDFLKLLVAQLQHQDPLNPMESADFTAQLAQFSSLEQLFNVNDNLEVIKDSKNEQVPENLLDYIGKEVKSIENNIAVYDGRASGGSYTLAKPGDVIISILDGDGSEIRTIYKSGQDSGEYDFYFDGKDDQGHLVPDGDYTFSVQAVDSQGFPVVVDSGLSGKVTAVTYQGDIPYLVVGDQLLSPQAVTEVRLSEAL
ncbi:MAG: flagellar hook assembly protein FlgD [Deltaproteobacteria bacterium]|nr:flagellar hook assembly protein FlgD [Deltaproteobacteria bacterium]